MTLFVRMWSGLVLLLPYIQIISARVRTSGRLLATPRVEKCEKRPKHYMDKRTGHYYFFSGKSHFGEYKVIIGLIISLVKDMFPRLVGLMLVISAALCVWT